jgi:putative nucleotidyltransferase with HDIG domain
VVKKERVSSATSDDRAKSGRSMGTGGRRLADAFEEVTRLPALDESRRRLLRLAEAESFSAADAAETVESDTGLTIAVLRAANNGGGPTGRFAGVREAVDSLGRDRVRDIAEAVETYDVLEAPSMAALRQERFRRHAVATRHAAERVADAANISGRDELAVAALLHDIGRLVITRLHGDEYAAGVRTDSPERRVRRERRDLGIDHALVGGVLVRRWGLRNQVAAAIEHHHAADAEGAAAAIRLADAIAHQIDGDAVTPDALLSASEALNLDRERLRSLLYDFPHSGEARRRSADPCPLSVREIDALRGLAEGKVYKQIAQELSLSVSTIRTHLHNVYRKIGAVDRAQAVLIARDRGWI